MKDKTAIKNNLIGILEQTYPEMNSLFSSPVRKDGKQKWIDVILTFWHIDCLKNLILSVFIECYKKWFIRKGYSYQSDKPTQVYTYSKELI